MRVGPGLVERPLGGGLRDLVDGDERGAVARRHALAFVFVAVVGVRQVADDLGRPRAVRCAVDEAHRRDRVGEAADLPVRRDLRLAVPFQFPIVEAVQGPRVAGAPPHPGPQPAPARVERVGRRRRRDAVLAAAVLAPAVLAAATEVVATAHVPERRRVDGRVPGRGDVPSRRRVRARGHVTPAPADIGLRKAVGAAALHVGTAHARVRSAAARSVAATNSEQHRDAEGAARDWRFLRHAGRPAGREIRGGREALARSAPACQRRLCHAGGKRPPVRPAPHHEQGHARPSTALAPVVLGDAARGPARKTARPRTRTVYPGARG